MKNIFIGFCFAVLLMLAWPCAGLCQNKKAELQADKERIEKEIAYTNKLLEDTQKDKKSSINQIYLLDSKIKKREQLIQNHQRSIDKLKKVIDSTQDSVRDLNQLLEKQKQEYAQILVNAYKSRGAYDRLAFVFSATDFNQAFNRLKYLQQYGVYRKKQADLILATQEVLETKIQRLEIQKNEKSKLKTAQEHDLQLLSVEKQQKNSTVKQLTKKERELRQSIKKQQRAVDKLQNAITKIISDEIRKAEEAARKAGKKENASGSYALTPEEKQLSASFSKNKGKLPWPLQRGVIVSSFGEHPHPVLKGIKVKNNGIDLITNTGEVARAVFGGKVTSIMTVPNFNTVVIIRHGEYRSVYANISKVSVAVGDEVAVKQSIGVVDSEDGKGKLHFEIWKAKVLQNPANWILRK